MSVELADYLEGGLSVVVNKFVECPVDLVILVSVNHHDAVVVRYFGDDGSDGRNDSLIIVIIPLNIEYTSVIIVGNACYIYHQRGGPADVPYIPASEVRSVVMVAECGAVVRRSVMVVRPVCHWRRGSVSHCRRGSLRGSCCVPVLRRCWPVSAVTIATGMRLPRMSLSGMPLYRAAVHH